MCLMSTFCCHYMTMPTNTAYLPYGKTASISLARGTKQGDKLSPLLFDLVFNCLLLALRLDQTESDGDSISAHDRAEIACARVCR
jgi:hypothetical protein